MRRALPKEEKIENQKRAQHFLHVIFSQNVMTKINNTHARSQFIPKRLRFQAIRYLLHISLPYLLIISYSG